MFSNGRLARLLRRARADERGFGLIELTIALTVLAIGVSSLAGLFVTGHLALRRATQSDSAAVLAEKLLERFRAETWDTIALRQDLFDGMASDTAYAGDDAYDTSTAITDSSGPCMAAQTPVACNPSRSIPDTSQTPTEVAPDGRLYRVDTYVNWGCYDGGAPDMSTSPPTCTSLADGTVQPFGQVKVVTVVVRDATSTATLDGSPVYRVSSTFDRLKGDAMPTVTVTPTGTSATTTAATTTTPGSTPAPPETVALANGAGDGNAYVNAGNATSISVDVELPASSSAADTITLTVSDGDPTHDQTATAAGTSGAGTVHFTGINGQLLNDGTITFSATATNAAGTSAATTSTATKDTVAPSAPTSVSLANGRGTGSAYINGSIKSAVSIGVGLDSTSSSSDTVSVTLTNGASSTSAVTIAGIDGGGSGTVTGIDASSLADGTVTAKATVADVAGNTSTAATATMPKDTVAVLSGVAYNDKNNTTKDQISGTSESNAKVTISQLLPLPATFGPTTLSTAAFSIDVAALTGTNLLPIVYSYTVSVQDQAGNTKSTNVSGSDKK